MHCLPYPSCPHDVNHPHLRRDAEGSDSDTRRRAAADLVKSLTEKFPQEVTGLFTGYVQVCALGWDL